MATLKIRGIGCYNALERDMRERRGEVKKWENKVKNLDGKCITMCYT
jgi:hypothetical protein